MMFQACLHRATCTAIPENIGVVNHVCVSTSSLTVQWALMQAGHALAAAAEGVGLCGVSLFLFLLLPGAYVSLNTDNLAVLGPLKALRVRSSATCQDAKVRERIEHLSRYFHP